MIKNVRLKNYKNYKNSSIDLERITAVVGPNASGKTNLLRSIQFLSGIGQYGSTDTNLKEEQWYDYFKIGATGEMEIECSDGDQYLRYWLTATDHADKPIKVMRNNSKNVRFSVGCEYRRISSEVTEWERLLPDRSPFVQFGPSSFIRLDPSMLARAYYDPNTTPSVDDSGRGLASTLAFLALNDPDQFQLIQNRLRSVIPAIDRLRFDRMKTSVMKLAHDTPESLEDREKKNNSNYITESIVFDMVGSPGIPARSASEGTLIVLGLLTIIMGQDRPRILLLDDIEHGLHPKAQRDLVGLLRKLLDEYADLQIILTTHSPYLLDQLDPHEIRLTTLTEDGSAAVAPLTSHPDFERWKDEMSPGELWSLFGEKWAASVGS